GFPLPEFVQMGQRSRLMSRKLGRLRPWAWSPDSVELLKPIFAAVTAEKRTAEQRFNKNIAQLHSKAWSATLLRKVLSHFTAEPGLCSKHKAGGAVDCSRPRPKPSPRLAPVAITGSLSKKPSAWPAATRCASSSRS